MLKASTTNKEVLSMEVEKEDGPFFCPSCRGKVILKKGRIKIPHFAHKPPVTCIYGKGESEIHYKAKLEIRDVWTFFNSILKF